MTVRFPHPLFPEIKIWQQSNGLWRNSQSLTQHKSIVDVLSYIQRKFDEKAGMLK